MSNTISLGNNKAIELGGNEQEAKKECEKRKVQGYFSLQEMTRQHKKS